MRAFADQAREYERRGDVVLQRQAAAQWHELATPGEAARAPKRLIWIGRKA